MNRFVRTLATSRQLYAKNPFDQVDVHSINAMDKILGILSSTQQQSSQEDETVRFGKQIFEYKLIRYLNERHIIARDSRIWAGTRGKYKEFYRDSMEDYNKLTECTNNDNYLELVRKFVSNDIGCLQSMDNPMKKMILLAPKKIEYGFPPMNIPAAVPYYVDNKYLFQKSPNPKKNCLYLLPFLVNDPFVIRQVIQKYQAHNGILISPYPMINSLMEAQEYEGEVLFNILVKRAMYKHSVLRNDFIREKFLHQPNKLKVILCHQAALISRIESYRLYKEALPKIQIMNTAKLMVNNFNRFLAVLYVAHRQPLLNWIEELMLYYNKNQKQIKDDVLYNHAMSYIDKLLEMDMPKIDLEQDKTRALLAKAKRKKMQESQLRKLKSDINE